MRRIPRHEVSTRRAAPLLAATALGLFGCSYDWTIGAPAPGTGGAGGLGGSGGGDGGSGSAGGAGGIGGAGDCEALAQRLEEAREAARLCTVGAPGQCAEKVQDECGCPAYLREAGAGADAFVAAVEAIEAAGCTVGCTACAADPGAGTCLFVGGMGPYCQP